MPEEGINPEDPPELLYELWQRFLDLNASRGSGMGPAPITQLDLYAYAQLHQIRFQEWELAALRHLDRIALNGMNETKE